MTPASATGMELSSRVGTDSDIPVLAALYRAFREDLRGERGADMYLTREVAGEPVEHFLETVLGDREHQLVLLGLVDEVPVGLAIAQIEELADRSRSATAEVIYVEPAAREVGVGEKLVEQVAEWAAGKSARGLDVLVLPGIRESKNFLEGAGFVARLLVMHRRLD